MVKQRVEIVGLADHHNVKTGISLRDALRDAGIVVFPGFEATTREGVHVVCLFDPESEFEELHLRIGTLEATAGKSGPGKLNLDDLCRKVEEEWHGATYAAHVTYPGGLLNVTPGQTRVRMWTSPWLRAAAIPCEPNRVNEQDHRDILNGKGEYQRDRPLALICANDVSGPDDVTKVAATTWLKMPSDTIEGLRQSFLDPESRVRRPDQKAGQEHPSIDLVAWEGGYLGGEVLRLSDSLNTLIGGRGTGKSTVSLSTRYDVRSGLISRDPLCRIQVARQNHGSEQEP